jgi:lactoylglutathione lyase
MAVSFKTIVGLSATMRRMALQMRLGWVIVYVDEPPTAVEFYERTFGFKRKFVAPGGSYAELDTGSTTFAFASYELGEKNFPGGVRRAGDQPANVEITLVTTEVDAAFELAVSAGCTGLAGPEDKPQGQRVAYVRDPFGTLIELATPL